MQLMLCKVKEAYVAAAGAAVSRRHLVRSSELCPFYIDALDPERPESDSLAWFRNQTLVKFSPSLRDYTQIRIPS